MDLVVLDMMMPGMNGTEALACMLRINPDVKAIMISGGRYSRDEIRRVGAVDFAPKPFGIPQLLELVEQYIRRKPSPDMAACGPVTPSLTARPKLA